MSDPERRIKACAEVADELERWVSGFEKVVIVGIGNSLRKDDFVGVKIVRELKDKVSTSVHLIECETVPESYLESIIESNPTHILVIDAALLNLKPGSSRLVSPRELQDRKAVSTHILPLRLFCDYLTQTVEAKIALLLIQPKDTSFGEGLTEDLENAAKCLMTVLTATLSQ